MKVVINPAYENLRYFIEALPREFELTGDVIFEGRNVLKCYNVGGISLVVKRFKIPHFINRIAYVSFRSSKAARSYNYGLKLMDLGITTAQPVAYIEEYKFGLGYSYFVTLKLKDMEEVRLVDSLCNTKEAVYVWEALGEYTAFMHKKNVLHNDYSPGNILFNVVEDQVNFSLIDINRMTFGVVGEEVGYKNFERLWLSDQAFVSIAKGYAASMGYNEAKAIKRICYYKDRFMGRYQ